MRRHLLGLIALTLGTAQAHAALTRVTPAPGSTGPAPEAVTLQFSEPLSTRFSSFRVMRVPASSTPAQAATAALALKAGVPALATAAVNLPATAALIRLPLKTALPKGVYVVAWKILSDDSHPVTDFRTFTVR
ncbi:copper resistance protein CopC [Deinococcus sp. HMF7620]|uniref:Copper resistance protein CopC n=1 Tax=Deinococcus arboris TaxID=2682977 RepID=A0A7C9LQW8_9DEIO|nr:copper resistance protein CopC [Deinococcus arboris]MVN88916.1 copper resistance protein CopC [Deinococcus arboris]